METFQIFLLLCLMSMFGYMCCETNIEKYCYKRKKDKKVFPLIQNHEILINN